MAKEIAELKIVKRENGSRHLSASLSLPSKRSKQPRRRSADQDQMIKRLVLTTRSLAMALLLLAAVVVFLMSPALMDFVLRLLSTVAP